MSKKLPADSDSQLINLPLLQKWLEGNGLLQNNHKSAVGILEASRISGGQSHVMFRLTLGDFSAVLRRPSAVHIPKANDGIKREHRLLKVLKSENFPAPRPLALCEDESLLGCSFYLMSYAEGFNPTNPLPEEFAEKFAGLEKDMTNSMVETLAELHKIDWQKAGLGDFGKPEGFHERQVERWLKQLQSYEGREISDLNEAGGWLKKHLPKSYHPTIMHADFHMFNVIMGCETPPKVSAVVDWETATIGDPLLDLVGFCEAWCGTHSGNGWPDARDIIEHYRSCREFEQDVNLDYYGALYNFRMSVLLEGIYQRSLRDSTREPAEKIGERALYNASRAREIIDSGLI